MLAASLRAARRRTAIIAAVGASASGLAAPTASASINPVKPACSIAGFFSGTLGKVCSLAGKASGLLSSGSSLASKASTGLALAAVVTWVTGGASFALEETAKVLSQTTTPRLASTWFSGAYWRVAGISALLTLPFLFAAALQALVRSDLVLLIRSSMGYLPLAMLAVSIAAPVTMLLLAGSDELCALVSSAAGGAGSGFLTTAAKAMGAFTLLSRSPFLLFFGALLTVGGAMLLWLELVVREAAVYVIVLMLPLAFAAMVWPARRVWVLRAVEVLMALILSKFVIVAVLSLGGAALTHAHLGSLAGMISGAALLAMGVFAPWALLRLVPMAEIAAGAATALHADFGSASRPLASAASRADSSDDVAVSDPDAVESGPAAWARWAAEEMGRARQAVRGRRRTVPADGLGLDNDETVEPQAAGDEPGAADSTGTPRTAPADKDGLHVEAAAHETAAREISSAAHMDRATATQETAVRDPTLDAILGAEDSTLSLSHGADGSPPRWTQARGSGEGPGEIHDPTPLSQDGPEEVP